MESERFDRLTRALAVAPSRRGVTHAIISLALGGVAASAPIEPAEAKKCGPCKKKKKGKCKKRKPNDTACNGTGKCLNGTCNPLPTCFEAFDICILPPDCCSGVCQGGNPALCALGAAGTPCFENNDCFSNACIGFRCQ